MARKKKTYYDKFETLVELRRSIEELYELADAFHAEADYANNLMADLQELIKSE